jgi:HSP20 family molecular chaperone IbpA
MSILSDFLGIDPLFGQLVPLFDVPNERRSAGRTNQLANAFPSYNLSIIHPMDVVEGPKSYEIHTDAPGMTADEIKVELYDKTLTISGEHKAEQKHEESGKIWRRERTSRKFTRTFVLPDDSKPNDLSASLENGVLKVSVPKIEETEKPKPKRITIATGGSSRQDAAAEKTAKSAGA